MATQATLSDVIERLRAEGQLTRNTGAHSIKSVKVEMGILFNTQTDVLREMLTIMQAQEARALLGRVSQDETDQTNPIPPRPIVSEDSTDQNAGKSKGGILSMLFGPAITVIKDFGSSILSFLKPLKGLLRLVRVGGPIAIAVGLLWEVFKDIGENETFINAIKTVKQVWNEKVLPTFERLQTLFSNFINSEGTTRVIEGALAIWDTVRTAIQNFFSNTIATLATAVGGILDGLNMMLDGDILAGLGKIVGSLLSGIMGMVDNILTGIFELFGVDFGEDGTWFGFLGRKFSELWDWITGVFGGIGTFISESWNTFTGGVTSIGSWIWNQISGAWNWITGIFGGADTFVKDSWNTLTGGVTSIGSWILSKIEGVWSWLSGLFPDVTTFLADSWNTLTGGIASIGSWIFGKIEGVWGWLGDLFPDVKTFLADSWNTLTGGVTSIGSWIWGKVEGVWNWITGMFDDLLGVFPSIEEMKATLLSYLPEWMQPDSVEEQRQNLAVQIDAEKQLVAGGDMYNWRGKSREKIISEMESEFASLPTFRNGSKGFMDFGEGSMAMLHGLEAVVPRNTPAGEFLTNNFDENFKPIMGRIANVENAAIQQQGMSPTIVVNAPTVAPVNNNVTGPTNVSNQRVTSIGTGSGMSGLGRFAN